MDKSGILLAIDFKKAFDSLEWKFMVGVLKAFNFGSSFIKWIETIYNSPEACIKNNGYLSNYFELSRGIRQGCPISALLFILSVELLAIKIRTCSNLKGFDFNVNEKPVKISQYADDATLFINNKEELCTVLNVISEFGHLSGTKLNLSKSEGFWLGREKHKQLNCNLFGIKWPPVLRCLGIYVGYDQALNEKFNWLYKLDKIDRLLSSWSKRDISFYGRIVVIKTFAIAQIVQSASLLTVPKGLVV